MTAPHLTSPKTTSLTWLTPDHLDAMTELEVRAFEPGLRASRDTYRRRFDLGHAHLGAIDSASGRLAAILGCYIEHFDPDLPENFPRRFSAYASRPTVPGANTIFVYNLGIDPRCRRFSLARDLVYTAVDTAKRTDGCTGGVADGAIPSYQGSLWIARKEPLRRLLDAHLDGGPMPARADLLQDPLLRFYHRISRCRFLRILPNFVPSDVASGGLRVLMFRSLDGWPEPPSRELRRSCHISGHASAPALR